MSEQKKSVRKKHSFEVRWRAFRIWQELGALPWKAAQANARSSHDDSGSSHDNSGSSASLSTSARGRKTATRDLYKGAFDSIPFLNNDAKRTFAHLLLRPGYMIRDYIRGDHERYLAPFTSLIIFYAFFALVAALLQPVQQHKDDILSPGVDVTLSYNDNDSTENHLIKDIAQIVKRGYIYLNLDQYPDEVHTRGESALAALEGTLRSQGIPLFLGQFLLLWFAMGWVLRRQKIGMSAVAAAAAYILCQFSFFMLFALLLTFGKSKELGGLVLLALVMIDFRQWLGVSWGKSFKLTLWTGVAYAFLFVMFILAVSMAVLAIATIKGV